MLYGYISRLSENNSLKDSEISTRECISYSVNDSYICVDRLLLLKSMIWEADLKVIQMYITKAILSLRDKWGPAKCYIK